MPVTDILIVGSGIAGLSTAIKVAERFPDRKITILSKDSIDNSNTKNAQGGIAVVSDLRNDSHHDHISDTLAAGDGLCNVDVVQRVVFAAGERLEELVAMGVKFDRTPDGTLSLGKEGGHHINRIVHCKDQTGLHIEETLINRMRQLPNIRVLPYHTAIDLIMSGTQRDGNAACFGVLAYDRRQDNILKFMARVTILATGGIGHLYRTTTNPAVATGDGIAIAYRAGARISNMEFIQFHPTALIDPAETPSFLVSEAVRGRGAYLRNERGHRFMVDYHQDAELACRDIVSRAIHSEIMNGNECSVFLDCTHIADEFKQAFPTIYKKCIEKGIDPATDQIPVGPAAHYLCGGIDTDLDGQTSIKNLYACGECANTGLHGANRLASNSLLEALVYSHAIAHKIKNTLEWTDLPTRAFEIPVNNSRQVFSKTLSADIKLFLQNVMTEYAGVVRTTAGLCHASELLSTLKQMVNICEASYCASQEWFELRNMVECATLIISQSLNRTENKGGFFNKDLETLAVETRR